MICPRVPEAEITPVANSGEYLLRSMVGRDSSPMVTTVAPTIPVEAARKAPTTTTETARPPGRAPKTRAIEVSRSWAIRERSREMPMRMNMATARSSSMEGPASTRSFIRLTMNVRMRKKAPSTPFSKTGTVSVGRSG